MISRSYVPPCSRMRGTVCRCRLIHPGRCPRGRDRGRWLGAISLSCPIGGRWLGSEGSACFRERGGEVRPGVPARRERAVQCSRGRSRRARFRVLPRECSMLRRPCGPLEGVQRGMRRAPSRQSGRAGGVRRRPARSTSSGAEAWARLREATRYRPRARAPRSPAAPLGVRRPQVACESIQWAGRRRLATGPADRAASCLHVDPPQHEPLREDQRWPREPDARVAAPAHRTALPPTLSSSEWAEVRGGDAVDGTSARRRQGQLQLCPRA